MNSGEIRIALAATGYVAEEASAVALWLAMELEKPLFLEGDPGVGKTELARAMSEVLNLPLIRLQCYEGIDAAQALYDWDFPRQILHVRAAESAGLKDVGVIEHDLYDRRFLIARPLLRALEEPCVLLIDEVDRADDEFEAFLLEILSDFAITIPEIGRIAAKKPPLTILTSNRTRDVHDALKRRCLYQYLEHPDLDRAINIIRARLPEISFTLAEQVSQTVDRIRKLDLIKAPGTAESLDWAATLLALGVSDITPEATALSLGALLKYQDDIEQVRSLLAT
ncbi:MAG TPA: MoxR family ATPase [Candidatus Nanopelagicaceae bacterium]|nr:MoxR family ATPase [Candidatus Nanopelagicaceae bacterium]